MDHSILVTHDRIYAGSGGGNIDVFRKDVLSFVSFDNILSIHPIKRLRTQVYSDVQELYEDHGRLVAVFCIGKIESWDLTSWKSHKGYSSKLGAEVLFRREKTVYVVNHLGIEALSKRESHYVFTTPHIIGNGSRLINGKLYTVICNEMKVYDFPVIRPPNTELQPTSLTESLRIQSSIIRLKHTADHFVFGNGKLYMSTFNQDSDLFTIVDLKTFQQVTLSELVRPSVHVQTMRVDAENLYISDQHGYFLIVNLKTREVETKNPIFHDISIFHVEKGFLYAGNNRGKLLIYDLKNSKELASFSVRRQYAVTAEVTALFVENGRFYAACNGIIDVFDCKSCEHLISLDAGRLDIKNVFVNQGKLLATSYGSVKSWDLTTYQPEDLHYPESNAWGFFHKEGEKLFANTSHGIEILSPHQEPRSLFRSPYELGRTGHLMGNTFFSISTHEDALKVVNFL